MVYTKQLNSNPPLLYHRVCGAISDDEAVSGAAEAMSNVVRIVAAGSTFDIILDMRGYAFNSLHAHGLWAQGLKEQKTFKENVKRCAVVGDDVPLLRAEKAAMESDVLRFFTELKPAETWLSTP